jgi:ribosome biogenesis GTPase
LRTSRYDLYTLGWTPELSRAYAPLAAPGLVAGRVGAQTRAGLVLLTSSGDLPAEPSGRLRHVSAPEELPVIGDWVVARLAPDGGRAVVERVLPRRTAFVRAGGDLSRPDAPAAPEIVAANADLVLVVTAVDGDLSPRRLERYLAAAWESGARPVVVLTKVDLVDDPAPALDLVAGVAAGVAVHAVSNLTGEGVEGVRALLTAGKTAALLGSSGVGKSSLVNRLLGDEREAVGEVRADGRGRHTTTHRELLLLRDGGLLLDTPGMRVLTPWDGGDGLDAAFDDVEALAAECRFADCAHGPEPGCAVQAAVASGVLRPDRLAGYEKLRRELAHLERKGDKRAEAEARRRWRASDREYRRRQKERR